MIVPVGLGGFVVCRLREVVFLRFHPTVGGVCRYHLPLFMTRIWIDLAYKITTDVRSINFNNSER
jgi:hypothetical protein